MSEFSINKLALFPEKLDALQRAHAGEVDKSYPVSVELSLTDACNFVCEWCSDAGLRERLQGSMKADTLFSLIKDLGQGGTKGVTIEGGGEPTLHPLLGATISHIRDEGMAAGLITNGARFNYKDQFDDLEWVRVSLDVADAHQMSLLKKEGAFNAVMGNIAEMARVKRNTVLGISYIVTNKSRIGLEAMVRRLSDIGVDYVQVKPVVDHPSLALGKDNSLQELKKFERERFRVFLDALDDNVITGNAGVPCVSNSLATVISANGNVYFCGRLNVDPNWPALGNVNTQSFQAIWLGEERRRQSVMMRESGNCQAHCPECRLTKFNVAVDNITRGADRPVAPTVVRTPNFI